MGESIASASNGDLAGQSRSDDPLGEFIATNSAAWEQRQANVDQVVEAFSKPNAQRGDGVVLAGAGYAGGLGAPSSLSTSQRTALARGYGPLTDDAARMRLFEDIGGGVGLDSSDVDMVGRFGQGLVGAVRAVTVEPVLQVRDMGMALASVTYNTLIRNEGNAMWFPEMKSGMSQAYDAGASQTRLLLQSNPLTGIGVASYDLTTAWMNRDWGTVAEMSGGLLGGFALGKATSAYGGYGVRWAPGDIGTMPMQSQRGATSLLNFEFVRPTPRFTSDGLQIPFGFKSEQEFMDFSSALRAGLPAGVEPVFQGSSVTGVKAVSSGGIKAGTPFDKGRISDFDIGLISEDLATQASLLNGMRVKTLPTRLGPLDADSSAQLGLGNLAERLSLQAGRPVNFLLYDSMEGAYSQPSLFVPKRPR